MCFYYHCSTINLHLLKQIYPINLITSLVPVSALYWNSKFRALENIVPLKRFSKTYKEIFLKHMLRQLNLAGKGSQYLDVSHDASKNSRVTCRAHFRYIN